MDNTIFARVVDCIAKTTRYPHKLLQPQADLEIDLGIDSVKRLEIVVALEKEFGLELASQPRDSSIKTIEDIGSWVEGMMNSTPSVPQGDAPETNNNGFTSSPPSQPVATPPGFYAPPTRVSSPRYESQPPSPVPVSPTRFGSNFNGSNGHNYENPRAVPSGNSNGFATQAVETVSPGRSLAGKIAFVTGSGRSVGKVIARVLASRGATVIVNSFHSRDQGEQTVAEINSTGGQAIHIWGSVANPAQVDDMFEQIESRFGRLDILVCNASDGKIGSFMELNSEDWDRAFRTNVSGHHQCALRAAPLMQRAGGGAIVTMSAVGAHGYVDGLGSQGVVKAAVESMSRYLACELGKFGIRVNSVAGGPVYGDLLEKFPNAQAAQHHWESVSPDGNLTSPLDIANTIAFLVSEEARGINGAVWTVDHGFSAMESGQPVPQSVARTSYPASFQ